MKRIVALAGFVFLTPTAEIAQTAPPPGFEVATVKPFQLPPGSFLFGWTAAANLKINGNRVTTRSSLEGLLAAAYNLKAFQISVSPGWTDLRGQRLLFDLEAKSEGEDTPTLDQVRHMLQTLLAERFQLKLRHETKTLPVYDLVVGKGGAKLKESAGIVPPPPARASGPLGRFTLYNRSMDDLADLISGNVDRPVLDKTGLRGRYDFTLEFTRGNPDLAGSADDDRSIFSAVQQQLGLKLVPANEPAEILVIDHAEKPAGN